MFVERLFYYSCCEQKMTSFRVEARWPKKDVTWGPDNSTGACTIKLFTAVIVAVS